MTHVDDREYCQIVARARSRSSAPLYIRSNQKIESSVTGSPIFNPLLRFFLLFFSSSIMIEERKRESPSSSLSLLFRCFSFSLFFFFDLGLYDPHSCDARGEVEWVLARVNVCRCPASGKVVQWGHMSKQLAHRCIEFTEEPMGDVHVERIVELRHAVPAPLSMNFRRPATNHRTGY